MVAQALRKKRRPQTPLVPETYGATNAIQQQTLAERLQEPTAETLGTAEIYLQLKNKDRAIKTRHKHTCTKRPKQ
jgi:hypothetical protein